MMYHKPHIQLLPVGKPKRFTTCAMVSEKEVEDRASYHDNTQNESKDDKYRYLLHQ